MVGRNNKKEHTNAVIMLIINVTRHYAFNTLAPWYTQWWFNVTTRPRKFSNLHGATLFLHCLPVTRIYAATFNPIRPNIVYTGRKIGQANGAGTETALMDKKIKGRSMIIIYMHGMSNIKATLICMLNII